MDRALGRIVAADAEQDTGCKSDYEKEDRTDVSGAADEVDEFTYSFSLPNARMRLASKRYNLELYHKRAIKSSKLEHFKL